MNPVFVFLVIIAAVLLWYLLAFAFGFVGGIAKKLNDDAKKAMFDEEREKDGE